MLEIFQGRILIVRVIMLAAMAGLITIGILTIYASGNPGDNAADSGPGMFASAWKKQLFFAMLGTAAILAINMIDYRWLGPLSYWIYGAILGLLALLLVGKFVRIHLPPVIMIPVINGTCRWIRFGTESTFIQFQPSEACKIAYILALAWYLRYRANYDHFKGLIGPFALTVLAMVLILFEPDLGTVLLMMPVLFSMLFVAGAKVKHLLIIILLAVMVSPVLWVKMNHYQRLRISSVLLQSPWLREQTREHEMLSKILTGRRTFSEAAWNRGSGWQLTSSKYAIASGGVHGYGFADGPYIDGPYLTYNLPERHNDFIFAIIAHQWGIWGTMAVIGLYAVFIACGLEIAWLNTDAFGRLVTIGVLAMFAVEAVVNISMTLGLMPITGLTLPFVSYGGSSLLVSMAAAGILNNIGKFRPFSVAGKAFESSGNPYLKRY